MKFKGRGLMQITGRTSLEDAVTEFAAKQLQENIDRQVLFDMLVKEFGWTKIVLPNKFLPISSRELHEWKKKNLKGVWRAHDNVWVFEKPEDATLFALRWS